MSFQCKPAVPRALSLRLILVMAKFLNIQLEKIHHECKGVQQMSLTEFVARLSCCFDSFRFQEFLQNLRQR